MRKSAFFAPVLLVTLRIIQGLGAGAEISGAGTMLAEYAPKGKRGIISSLVAMGTNCGTLSATAIWAVMFFALEREQLIAWGWRIPFLASVVVMIFAIWLRMNLKESPVFEKVSEGEKIASVNACVRKYIGRDVYQQIFLAGHRFTFLDKRGIPGLFKPSLPDIWFRRYYLTNLSQPMR